ncbi:hypothetical protein [Aminobacter sp. Piv2-1]|uniref:hypothetical protein n=1 Tax=Aminobacter sp. Piv2-1 TaxID=3031122 RepID=UPI0030ABE524
MLAFALMISTRVLADVISPALTWRWRERSIEEMKRRRFARQRLEVAVCLRAVGRRARDWADPDQR